MMSDFIVRKKEPYLFSLIPSLYLFPTKYCLYLLQCENDNTASEEDRTQHEINAIRIHL